MKFKKGDIVEIVDNTSSRHWMNIKDVLGKRFLLTKKEAKTLSNDGFVFFNDNKYCINFTTSMLKLIGNIQEVCVCRAF